MMNTTKGIIRNVACLMLTFAACLSSVQAQANHSPSQSPAQKPEQSFPKVSGPCDRACLEQTMQAFLVAATTNQFGKVPAIAQAEIRENARAIALADSTWAKVRAIRSVWVFADAVTGNVIGRTGVELADGKPGYISTRLKVVADGKIADIEIAADTSNRVVKDYVWNLDQNVEKPLAPAERIDRISLEALALRYFMSLSTHVAMKADFDDRACNRFHSGMQITNAARNAVEGGPARTCVSSVEGNPPWGPATEQRVPVIDEERGIVIGITLLHYLKSPRNSKMYVWEVFKVVNGKIIRIDNIGLMQDGLTTLGFVH
ncbi:MAG: hypothetical protein JNM09_02100 [Blastocatellia bacterium]|nr:hypothetical protein [Blastocatellia bacterium]